MQKLDIEASLAVLSSAGPLAMHLKGFEARVEQKEMMRNVLEAYNQNHIALIEAGTGTGKSLAYLIPAMLWAIQNKERTVISTNTITLQEQLLIKDIPLLEKILKVDIKAVLVKGMHNYVCQRKLEETRHELLLLSPQEAEELHKIDAWNGSTRDGSRSSLPFAPSPALWDKVAAESDTCNRQQCPYYQQCHFFKARRNAQDAQILIVNHHLLFADLVYRAENIEDNPKENGLLPNYARLIIDEAHNIEDVATDYFASRLGQLDILRYMARLTAEKGGKVQGKLPLLKEKLLTHYRQEFSSTLSSIYNRLNIDIPGSRRDLILIANETFSSFLEFTKHLANSEGQSEESSQGDNKLRILPHHHTHPKWQDSLIPKARQCSQTIRSYAQSLGALLQDIKNLRDPVLDDQIKGIVFEIDALAKRFVHFSDLLESFVSDKPVEGKVRWIEGQTLKTMVNTCLVDANLDISTILVKNLFEKISTIVLCSATLTTEKHFAFIRSRLGLTAEKLKTRIVKEYCYESPFNFREQALLAIPTDLPNPSDPKFMQAASERIWQALQASRGNAFVLFTSYAMLKSCYEVLEQKLKENRFNPLKQGDENRTVLLDKFKKTDRSVLFGTDSFWEGVDVVGDALRCVIIVKLPFKVPTEPLFQARSESIAANGGDPFRDYSLPQAIVKFKQGFGRLIRNKSDRGCIICLDNRVITKRYGGLFLSSLPACQQLFVPSSHLHQQMSDFYRRTHFLVKSRNGG